MDAGPPAFIGGPRGEGVTTGIAPAGSVKE